MRRVRLAAAVLAALLVPVLATGCGEDEAGGTHPAAVEGVAWVLDVDGGPAPTATFEDGRVAGFAGCNRYTAAYTVSGARLSIEPAVTTRMACPPPAGEVESTYLAALERVSGWRVDGEDLVLVADGAPALRFRSASPVGSWTVTSLVNGDALTSPIPGSELTATFAEDGTLSGSAGCNSYTAQYVTTSGILEISPPASTRKFCEEPQGVMEQEASYLAALQETARAQLGERGLELLRADGAFVATYEAR